MFGFARINFSKPAKETQTGHTLVSKEDIYGTRANQTILLARKGIEISEGELPKFIKNGARSSQFEVKSYQTNPITSPIAPRRELSREQLKVMVLDPQQKSIKRTIDCLSLCGFNLSKIHPVRIPGHLNWALNKYQPDVLVVDFDLGNGSPNGISLLQQQQMPDSVSTLILTMENNQLREAERKWINRICAEREIKILFKPLNRHALSTLLDD